MIRIVQISDLHWRGLERHDEYQHVFNKLYKKLEELKPDIIINTGDTWHTKLQHITPEGFRRLRCMFVDLAKFAPVFNIYGNHDLNLLNKDRHNILWEVINSVKNEPDIFPIVLLEDSVKIKIPMKDGGKSICLYPFSMTDPKNWDELHRNFLMEGMSEDIRIALFHGSILNSTLQNGFKLKEAELDEENFLYDFPFAMLGDIHKRQYLAYRRDKDKEVKPYVAYPGSLIQQDFGETADTHGFLVWDFESEHDWNITEYDIENPFQMHSLAWDGVEQTLGNIKTIMEEKKLDTRASFRVQHGGIIFSNEVKELKELSYKHLGLSSDNLAFAYSKNIEEKIILENNSELKPNVVVKSNLDLLYSYLEEAPVLKSLLRTEDYPFVEQAIEKIEKIVEINEKTNTGRLVWKVRQLWFDNLFQYAEGNYINFDDLTGNIGVFGPNRIGKSAMLGAICYVLFNATDRGSIKDFHIINENKSYCRAKVHFELNGESYYVERMTTKKPKDEGTNGKVNFYRLNKDGIQESLNGGDRNDTDKKIRAIIGTFDDFNNTSLAAQSELHSFIKKGNTECKKALSRYFNIDNYLSLGAVALEDKKKYTERVADRTENSWAEEKQKIVASLDAKDLELKGRETELQVLNNKLKSLNEEITNLSVSEVNEFNLNKQLISKGNKDIQEYREQIEKLANKIAIKTELAEMCKGKVDLLSDKVKDYNKVISTIETYKRNLDLSEKEKNQQKKKLKLLDEIPCGDKYPTCSFIHDSFDAKERLPALEEAAAKALVALQEVEASLGRFDKGIDVEYQTASRTLKEATGELMRAEQEKEIYGKKLAREIELVDELEIKQETLLNSGLNFNIEEQIKTLSSEIKDVNAEISERKARIVREIIEIREVRATLADWEEKYKEFSINLQKLRVMTVIAEAFSKNGIPARILRDYMESVNFFAGLVTKDTDFDVRVRVDSESNSLDIDYVYKNRKRPIDTCSGAEKTFAAIALRVALIQCNSIPISNALFLDECFGALDEEMIIVAQQLLTSLESYFDSIFVISHEAYLKEMITKKLNVVKEEETGYSSIVYGEYKSPKWTEKFVS